MATLLSRIIRARLGKHCVNRQLVTERYQAPSEVLGLLGGGIKSVRTTLHSTFRRTMAVKKILTDFCGSTSAHGLPHVGSAENSCLRIFWALIFIAGTGAFIGQLYLLTVKYLEYGFNVQTQLYTDDRPFPVVTVCNLNLYKKSAVNDTSTVGRLIRAYDQAIRGTNNLTIRSKIRDRARDILLYLAVTDPSFHQSATYDQSELIVDCAFNAEKCKDSDIQKHMDPVYGACYSFNNKLTGYYNSSRPGATYGLKLLVKVDREEYLETTEMQGARVTIHGQGEPTFPAMFGYNAASGFTNSFSVSYTKASRLGSPYNPCVDESTPDISFYTGTYTTEACARTQLQKLVVDTCECAHPRYPKPYGQGSNAKYYKAPYCNVSTEQWNCAKGILASKTVTDKAKEQCTRPCVEGTYRAAVSTAIWPRSYMPIDCKNTTKWQDETLCTSWYEKNTLVIEVFFESASYQGLEDNIAYPVVSFIADIGGQMGLWIGFSAITIFEFFALLASLTFCCCYSKE